MRSVTVTRSMTSPPMTEMVRCGIFDLIFGYLSSWENLILSLLGGRRFRGNIGQWLTNMTVNPDSRRSRGRFWGKGLLQPYCDVLSSVEFGRPLSQGQTSRTNEK